MIYLLFILLISNVLKTNINWIEMLVYNMTVSSVTYV